MKHKIRHVLYKYVKNIEGSEEESSYMEGWRVMIYLGKYGTYCSIL
jgi:hypothetical protein